MTTDEGVLDADAKLNDALQRLQATCAGLGSNDAEGLAKQVTESPYVSGILMGFKVAAGDETVPAEEVLDYMKEMLETGIMLGLQAAGRAIGEVITETIKTMAK